MRGSGAYMELSHSTAPTVIRDCMRQKALLTVESWIARPESARVWGKQEASVSRECTADASC